MPKKKYYQDPNQITITQCARDMNARKRKAEEEEESKKVTLETVKDVEYMGTRTVPKVSEEKRRRHIELDEEGDIVVKNLDQKLKEKEEEEGKKSASDVYYDSIEGREYSVNLRNHDPLKPPLPGYITHLLDLEFIEQYHKHINSNIDVWIKKCKEILDEFMANTDFPEYCDEAQRDFMSRIEAIKEKIMELPIPLGMIDKWLFADYLSEEELTDEERDFLYEMARCKTFKLTVSIYPEKYNFTLDTTWMDNWALKRRSYGKEEVEDFKYLAPDYENSQPLL